MESADVDAEESSEGVTIDIKRYLFALVRYSWLIAAFVVVAVAGAVMYTLRQVPVYEASASVQIEPKLPDLLGTGDMFNVAAGTSGQEYYKQQQQVIGSYTLCQQTVEANDLIPQAPERGRARRRCRRRPARSRRAPADVDDQGQVSRRRSHHVRDRPQRRSRVRDATRKRPRRDVRQLRQGPALA